MICNERLDINHATKPMNYNSCCHPVSQQTCNWLTAQWCIVPTTETPSTQRQVTPRAAGESNPWRRWALGKRYRFGFWGLILQQGTHDIVALYTRYQDTPCGCFHNFWYTSGFLRMKPPPRRYRINKWNSDTDGGEWNRSLSPTKSLLLLLFHATRVTKTKLNSNQKSNIIYDVYAYLINIKYI